jgi:hypothetical protein
MKEWSKDQEEYTDRQFREVEEKKTALKSQAEKDAWEKAEIERQAQERKKQEEIARKARRKAEKAKDEAGGNEETGAVEKVKAKYRERFGQTLVEIREIEREQEEIKKARRKPGIPWGETSNLIDRQKVLEKTEDKLLREREALNFRMDAEVEQTLAALRRKWKQEDEA